MLEYKFHKNNDYTFILEVKKPYDLLGLAIDTDRTSQYISEIIEGITKVSTGENEDYSWQSQDCVLVYVCGYDANDIEEPEGGCYIYSLTDDDEEPKFKVSIDEMLKMLTEYKQFLIDNKR